MSPYFKKRKKEKLVLVFHFFNYTFTVDINASSLENMILFS